MALMVTNNSGFINYNVSETLKDSSSTPPSLKILHHRVHELVGGPLNPLPSTKLRGAERLKSGRAKFSKVERVDNF